MIINKRMNKLLGLLPDIEFLKQTEQYDFIPRLKSTTIIVN